MKVGFQGFLIEHGHNLNYKGNAQVVKNWEQIYDLLLKEVDHDSGREFDSLPGYFTRIVQRGKRITNHIL